MGTLPDVLLQPGPQLRGVDGDTIARESVAGSQLFIRGIQSGLSTLARGVDEWQQYQEAQDEASGQNASLQAYFEILNHGEDLKQEISDPEEYKAELGRRSEKSWSDWKQKTSGSGVEAFDMARAQYEPRLDFGKNNHARALYKDNGRAELSQAETAVEGILSNPAFRNHWPTVIKSHKAAINDSVDLGWYSRSEAQEMVEAFDAWSMKTTAIASHGSAVNGALRALRSSGASDAEQVDFVREEADPAIREDLLKALLDEMATDALIKKRGLDTLLDEQLSEVGQVRENGSYMQKSEIHPALQGSRRDAMERSLDESKQLRIEGKTDPEIYNLLVEMMQERGQEFLDEDLDQYVSNGLSRKDHAFLRARQVAKIAGDDSDNTHYAGATSRVGTLISHLELSEDRARPVTAKARGQALGSIKYAVGTALRNETQRLDRRLTPTEVDDITRQVVTDKAWPVQVDWAWDDEEFARHLNKEQIMHIVQDRDGDEWLEARDGLVAQSLAAGRSAIPTDTEIMMAIIIKYNRRGGEQIFPAEVEELVSGAQ